MGIFLNTDIERNNITGLISCSFFSEKAVKGLNIKLQDSPKSYIKSPKLEVSVKFLFWKHSPVPVMQEMRLHLHCSLFHLCKDRRQLQGSVIHRIIVCFWLVKWVHDLVLLVSYLDLPIYVIILVDSLELRLLKIKQVAEKILL